jgi:hypothetical protein
MIDVERATKVRQRKQSCRLRLLTAFLRLLTEIVLVPFMVEILHRVIRGPMPLLLTYDIILQMTFLRGVRWLLK